MNDFIEVYDGALSADACRIEFHLDFEFTKERSIFYMGTSAKFLRYCFKSGFLKFA